MEVLSGTTAERKTTSPPHPTPRNPHPTTPPHGVRTPPPRLRGDPGTAISWGPRVRRWRATSGRRLAAILAGFAVVAACGGLSGHGGVQRVVKVALVDRFSGSSESWGRYARNGLQVAVDALNAQGGLLGDRVEVVAADSEPSPAKAAELVHEQLTDDGVKLLVGPNSTAAFQALRQAIGAGGLPNCVTRVGDGALGGAGLTFRVGASDQTRVAALFSYLHQSRPDVRKVGLLIGDDAAQAIERVLTDQAGRSGLTYVGHAGVADADPAPALQQLVNQGAQAVVLADTSAAAVRAAQAVHLPALAGHLVLLGFGALTSYEFASAGGDAALGSVLATTNRAYLTGSPSAGWPPAYRAFVDTTTRQYGTAANGVEMQADPAAADCVLEWAHAVRRAGTFQVSGVVHAWEGLFLSAADTALGVTERPTAADHTAVGPDGVFVYTWTRDGSRYRLKQLAAPLAG